MKLLFVSTSARGETTGRLRWAPGLADRDVRCAFALPQSEQALFDRFRDAGVAVRGFGYQRSAQGLARIPGALAELARAIREEAPDVVHSFGHEANLLTAAAARLAPSTPQIAHITGLGAAFRNPRSAAARVLRALYRWEAPRIARFVFQNRDDPGALSFLAPSQVFRGSGTGVDCARQRPGAVSDARRAALRRDWALAPDDVAVVYAGRLTAVKGLDTLLAAWARQRSPAAALLLIGDGPLRAALERQAAAHGGRVHFLGRQEDIMPALAAADIFVNPAAGGDGLPRANIEAMAMGLPLITTDAVGCRDTAEHDVSGLLTPAGDVDRMARALERLIADRELRRRLGAAARVRAAARFDVGRSVEEVVDLSRSLAQGRRDASRRQTREAHS